MGLIHTADVKALLEDSEFMEEVVRALVRDPKALGSVADEIADKLEDALEHDSSAKRRIIDAALSVPELKERIIAKVVEELS